MLTSVLLLLTNCRASSTSPSYNANLVDTGRPMDSSSPPPMVDQSGISEFASESRTNFLTSSSDTLTRVSIGIVPQRNIATFRTHIITVQTFFTEYYY